MLKTTLAHAIKPLYWGSVCASVLLVAAVQANPGPVLDCIKSTGKITIAYLPGSPFVYTVE